MEAPYERAWSCGSDLLAITLKFFPLISDEAKSITRRNEHFIAMMSAVCLYVFSEQINFGDERRARLQMSRDDETLNLAGAFVDLGQAGVAVEPLHREVAHVAIAAMNLDGF